MQLISNLLISHSMQTSLRLLHCIYCHIHLLQNGISFTCMNCTRQHYRLERRKCFSESTGQEMEPLGLIIFKKKLSYSSFERRRLTDVHSTVQSHEDFWAVRDCLFNIEYVLYFVFLTVMFMRIDIVIK